MCSRLSSLASALLRLNSTIIGRLLGRCISTLYLSVTSLIQQILFPCCHCTTRSGDAGMIAKSPSSLLFQQSDKRHFTATTCPLGSVFVRFVFCSGVLFCCLPVAVVFWSLAWRFGWFLGCFGVLALLFLHRA